MRPTWLMTQVTHLRQRINCCVFMSPRWEEAAPAMRWWSSRQPIFRIPSQGLTYCGGNTAIRCQQEREAANQHVAKRNRKQL